VLSAVENLGADETAQVGGESLAEVHEPQPVRGNLGPHVTVTEEVLPVLRGNPEGHLVRNVVALVFILIGWDAQQAGLGIDGQQVWRGVARDVRADVGHGAERTVLRGTESIVQKAQADKFPYLRVILPEPPLHAVKVRLVIQLKKCFEFLQALLGALEL
jgi:hypothetical protein